MRKRIPITLAAGGRWPDAAASGGVGWRFNWVKIDNRGGANPVSYALSGMPAAADLIDTLGSVGAGKCRVFNVAGPKGEGTDDWPDEIRLVSAAGTTVLLELADHPIVDMTFAP